MNSVTTSVNSIKCVKTSYSVVGHRVSLKTYASINSSGAHPPPPGQPRGISHVVSPGGGALVNFIIARGLGISIPRGDPWAFDTRVLERWMSLSRRTRP